MQDEHQEMLSQLIVPDPCPVGFAAMNSSFNIKRDIGECGSYIKFTRHENLYHVME